jgi:hypothetical protein
MADKLDLEVTGKSKYEVAHQMASQILFSIEKKKWDNVTRTEYLRAHYDAMRVLELYLPE